MNLASDRRESDCDSDLAIEKEESENEMNIRRVNMKDNVKAGDEVHVRLHDLDTYFRLCKGVEGYAVYEAVADADGIKICDSISIDSLYDQNHAPKAGAYAEFMYAVRNEDSESLLDEDLSRKDVLTLFRKEDGSIWFLSRDKHPILLHGNRGNVTVKYATQCIDSYGFPGGESRYKQFDVPLK
jgi:hypothetical protein